MGKKVRTIQRGLEPKCHYGISKIKKLDFFASKDSPANQVLYLQKNIGNRAVLPIIQSRILQAKLIIGKHNDILEKEADCLADQVMRMRAPSCSEDNEDLGVQRQAKEEEIKTKSLAHQIKPQIQPQTDEEEELIQSKMIGSNILQRQESSEEEEEPIQVKSANAQIFKATSNLESSINALRGSGQPLPKSTRDFFESRFGTDFSKIRIHTDPTAANTANSMNARAFTIGKDIVFNAAQYSPDTIQGKKLLAHELTHTIQQKEVSPTQKSAVSYLQMWRFGRRGEPLPNPNYQIVPIKHYSIVYKAMGLVKKVVDNIKAYLGCRLYFEKKCGAGLDPNALKNAYNNAVIWYSTMNGTSFGGSMPGTHHMRYSPLAYRLGRWAIASTMTHEMFHRCDLATVNRELRAIEAEEKCRFYIPFIFSLNPKEGRIGDNVTITGTNFGDRQGRLDKVEFNGVNAGRVSSWGIYSITVKVPVGATTGPVVVTNNRVSSNKVNFVVKK